MAEISEKQPPAVYPVNPNQGYQVNQGYNQGPPVNQGYPANPGYPTGNLAPNVVNVVPMAGVGQQYRDQLFALCAQGQHERKTEYGVCGIITAIALFPFGLICLFLDTNVKCSRCGVSLPK